MKRKREAHTGFKDERKREGESEREIERERKKECLDTRSGVMKVLLNRLRLIA